jgi:hypothetical protein
VRKENFDTTDWLLSNEGSNVGVQQADNFQDHRGEVDVPKFRAVVGCIKRHQQPHVWLQPISDEIMLWKLFESNNIEKVHIKFDAYV